MRFKNILGVLCLLAVAAFAVAAQETEKRPDVPYVPTKHEVVEGMLKLAEVKRTDKLYDLGSGDGRIVIAAAKQYGAIGVGVDISATLVEEAKANAEKEGVSKLATFKQGDIFDLDFSDATVVTLYLLPDINLKLRPILWKQLKPGTRVVSHAFSMGDWKPEKTIEVEGATLYLWRIPEKTPENKAADTDQ